MHAAKRELVEETQIVAKNWKKLGFFYENPTRSPIKFYVFSAKATSSALTSTNLDIVEGEIKTQWVTKKEVQKDMSNKFLSSPMLTALAVYLFAEK